MKHSFEKNVQEEGMWYPADLDAFSIEREATGQPTETGEPGDPHPVMEEDPGPMRDGDLAIIIVSLLALPVCAVAVMFITAVVAQFLQ